MNASPIVGWVYALMVWAAPPERLAAAQRFPGWEETVEARSLRYESIAEDLVATVYDPAEHPVFAGKRGRALTAALLLALAIKETGLAPDADRGPCYRGRDGQSPRCDGGRSACMLQIRVGSRTTPEGWTREDLFADRRKCLHAGLHAVRRSAAACSREGPDFILNAYASGVCGMGYELSRARVALGRSLFAHRPPPGDDAAFVKTEPHDALLGAR